MHLEDPQVRTSEVAATGPDEDAPRAEMASPRSTRAGGRALFDMLGGSSPGSVTALRVAVGFVLTVAVVLRFWTRSDLWLDEALTVDIARRPLSQIPALLRHDGAPPLYYVMLHFWMKAFGQSNLGTRSLSGVIGLVNLPVAWLAGYRIGSRWWSLDSVEDAERVARQRNGRIAAWGTTLLLAASPFAIYYDTEARMYGLVILLGTLGIVAYTSVLRRPGVLPALGLAAVVSALLYSHYWSLYAGVVVGAGTLWATLRGANARAARWALGGLVAGAVSFVPWLPTFLFQLHHTGTPWATQAGFTTIVFTMTQFAGGNSVPGRGLALLFIFLALLAVAGAALDGYRVILDLRTRPGVRALLATALLTLVIGVAAARLSGGTFDVRYTAPIVAPALIVVAYGLTTLADARVRNGVLGLAVVLSLIAAAPNAVASRTEAGTVAAAIASGARPGDVVAYCPDQLGPAVSRVLGGNLDQITFPRGDTPEIVDWVDYLDAIKRASPTQFAERVERLAGATHTIWYVWAPAYHGFGSDCQVIAEVLEQHRRPVTLVNDVGSGAPFEIYEGETLERYSPR